MAEEPIHAHRTCTKCEQLFLLTPEHFRECANSKGGLKRHCRCCERERSRDRRAANPEKHKAYYQANRAHMLAQMRANADLKRFGERREETLAYWAAYRAKNKERIRAVQARSQKAAQHETNRKMREKVASDADYRAKRYAQIETWRRANRERARCYVRNRRAALKHNGGTHTKEDIDALWLSQVGCCAYCQVALELYHVDHKLPVSRGGSNNATNLALACPSCNHRKSSKTVEEFLDVR